MPHLERRYVPADKEFQAWLFGVLDAVEYLRDGKVAGEKFKDLTEWLESEVVEYYAEYQEHKKEKFKDAKREASKWAHPAGKGALPVSGGGVEPHRQSEETVVGGSARLGKNVGSVGRVRDGRIVFEWVGKHYSDSHPACECSDGVDRDA